MEYKKFSFFGKKYKLNVAKFKSFLLDSTSFVLGCGIIYWMVWTLFKGLFLGEL